MKTDLLNPIDLLKEEMDERGEFMELPKRIEADYAVMLEHKWGISAEYWMNLQMQYDLEVSRNKFTLASATWVKDI